MSPEEENTFIFVFHHVTESVKIGGFFRAGPAHEPKIRFFWAQKTVPARRLGTGKVSPNEIQNVHRPRPRGAGGGGGQLSVSIAAFVALLCVAFGPAGWVKPPPSPGAARGRFLGPKKPDFWLMGRPALKKPPIFTLSVM